MAVFITVRPICPVAANNGRLSRTRGTFFSLMKSDVLAFQEVNDEAALQKVIGKGYDIVFSERTQERHTEKRFHDINQFTGVAIKHGVSWQNMPDVFARST
ncbi:hypothetical protein QW180_29445 [Vibrio sinaloensis]|nr:hypothetical protein [Vibrio sinaloensis]